MSTFRSFAAVTMLVLATLVVSRAGHAAPPMANEWNGSEINWRDLKTGIYEASTSGKTAIMVFHAPWCTACRQYRTNFKDPGVVAASKNFVMILVDADADKMANGAFSPDGTYVPRTIFLNSEGDVLSKYVGKDPKYPHTIDIQSPDELRALMEKAATAETAPAAKPPQQDNKL
jgi:protein-disulfide reductase (glutathione)